MRHFALKVYQLFNYCVSQRDLADWKFVNDKGGVLVKAQLDKERKAVVLTFLES